MSVPKAKSLKVNVPSIILERTLEEDKEEEDVDFESDESMEEEKEEEVIEIA